MSGIEDVVAGLHAAISEGDEAIQQLRLAHEALNDSARGMYDVAYGTNDQDLAMVHEQLTRTVDDIELLTAGLEAARGRVGDLIAHYRSDTVDLDEGDDHGDTTPPPPIQPVRSPYGDLYPPGTEWAVDRLPPFSPLNSNQPVRGIMRIDGGEPIELRPGIARDALAAAHRGRRLRLGTRFEQAAAPGHIEFIAAMRMMAAEATSVDVVINRPACGYLTKADGDKREGCHQYLARFLPRGTRLNLYGTQGTDTVFIHTCEGTAEA